jgi:hypothetical protein
MKQGGEVVKKYLAAKYDSLLLDECQDMNSVMLRIIESYPGQKILIGDSHQAIYSFMGCVNAFKSSTHKDTNFKLTKSFRFGGEIATRADWIISKLKSRSTQTPFYGIQGNSKKNTIISDDPPATGKLAVIGRYNKNLFEESASYADAGKLIFWTNREDYHKKLESFVDIKENKQSWEWKSKKARAQEDEDMETVMLMNMIDDIGVKKINEMMRSITMKSVNEKKAEVVLTTVHKAKGLEWDNVLVCRDVGESLMKAWANLSYSNKDRVATLASYEEECNIYYVAVTRALVTLCDQSYTSVSELLGMISAVAEEVEDDESEVQAGVAVVIDNDPIIPDTPESPTVVVIEPTEIKPHYNGVTYKPSTQSSVIPHGAIEILPLLAEIRDTVEKAVISRVESHTKAVVAELRGLQREVSVLRMEVEHVKNVCDITNDAVLSMRKEILTKFNAFNVSDYMKEVRTDVGSYKRQLDRALEVINKEDTTNNGMVVKHRKR